MARRGSTEDSDFSPSVESDGDSEVISAVADVLERRTIPRKLIGKSNKRKTTRRVSNSSDSNVEKTKAKEVKLPSKASILVLAQVVSDGTEQNGAFKATYLPLADCDRLAYLLLFDLTFIVLQYLRWINLSSHELSRHLTLQTTLEPENKKQRPRYGKLGHIVSSSSGC